MTAGQRRKLYRNLQEQPTARAIAIVGARMAVWAAPFLCVLMFIGIGTMILSEYSTAGVALAASPLVAFGKYDHRNIKTLRQKKHDLLQEGEAILNAAKAAGRALTADENAKCDRIVAEAKKVGVEIAEYEAFMEQQRYAPAAGGVGASAVSPALAQKIGRKYLDMFPGATATRDFKSLNEFLEVVHSGRFDNRLNAAASGMNEGVPAEGGFLVPEQFAAELLDVSLENEIVRPRCTIVPMTSKTKKIAGWDGLDNSAGAPFGGFSVEWLAEGGSATNKKAKTRLIELTANKLALYTMASNELIADGMTFEQMLGTALVQAVGWGLDYYALQGDGAGKPLGILNDPALITVSKEQNQAAKTVVGQNIVNMYSRMHPACVNNAVWIANTTCIPTLSMAELGTGIAVKALLERSNGGYYMMTRPVIFTEKLPAIGTPGDLIFVDLTQYAMGLRKDVSVDKSMHVGWQTDESGYRAILRVAGQGRWNKPYTPKNGETLSWCVQLESRAV